MPYSIFFTQQGHAIHGTNHKITGTPESHGCVRLSVAHAGILWGLVKQQGMANVRVELDGRIPTRNELIARREPGSALTDRDYRNDPVYRGNERGFADGGIANDEPDVTGAVPPQQSAWREYREGGRVYYYRDGPDEERRQPARRRPHYYRSFGGFPFW
jgi:hypothetical protein